MSEQEGEQEGVSFFRDHMQREDVNERLMKLIEQRNYLDSQSFMFLNKIAHYLGKKDSAEANSLCTTRINVNDQFMRLVAGDLSVLEED